MDSKGSKPQRKQSDQQQKNRAREQARVRQARCRQKRMLADLNRFNVHLPEETVKTLSIVAALTGKKTAESVVQEAVFLHVKPILEGAEKLLTIARSFWPKIRPFMPVLSMLKPGRPPFTLHGRLYSYDEWAKLEPYYIYLVAEVRKLGHRDAVSALNTISALPSLSPAMLKRALR